MGRISKIKKYASASKLMDISVKYGDEKFNFNLFEELVIDENKINNELKEQPSSYGFLLLLHKKLLRIKDDLEIQKDKTWASAYIKAKNQTDKKTGRPVANELAKEMATANKKFNLVALELNKAKEIAELVGSCCRSFEQRGHLVQSIAANLRKEN